MAEFKYAVKNGDTLLGLMWKLKDGREIFVTKGDKVDINNSILVVDADENVVEEVEMLEFIGKLMP